jgi:hypothetical protein
MQREEEKRGVNKKECGKLRALAASCGANNKLGVAHRSGTVGV